MKRFWVSLAVFVSVFLSLSLFFSTIWLQREMQVKNFGQILFHLQFPVGGASLEFVLVFIKLNLLPSFLIALLVAFYKEIIPFVFKISVVVFKNILKITFKILKRIVLLAFVFFKNSFVFIQQHGHAFRLLLAVVVLFLSVNITINKLRIKDYFKEQQNVSKFYETYYSYFDLDNFLKNNHLNQNNENNKNNENNENNKNHSFEKRNLIVIFAESWPSAMSRFSMPFQNEVEINENLKVYSPWGDLAPQVEGLASQHINFSPTSVVGGLTQLEGTGWTIAGIVSYLCGVPINQPVNATTKKYFLNKAQCVPDILKKLGYKQIYISGQEQTLGGRAFFEAHHIPVHDVFYYQAQKLVPKPIPPDILSSGLWGVLDRETFRLAKKEVQNAIDSNESFAFYISTIDTHGEDFLYGAHSCPGYPNNPFGRYKCVDRV